MEKLLICKKCKSNLVQVGKKYVCSNENCDFQELAISKNWHEELANDSTVWNENIIKKAPSIIAYEYEKLRKLLLSGSTYGVQLQIKDLFEVILKFPALIILAESLQTKKKKEEYNDILHFMTSKQLSLGDWSQIANSILKKELKRDDVMIYLLKDVYEIYKKHNIISWRNDNIGHGALKLDDSMDFQTDIKKMLNLIFAHFNRCEKWYIDIILNLKSKGQYSPLIGESMARNINLTTGVPVVKVDRKYIELDPLIQYENKGIYFFDSYGSIKNIASLINYPSGDKIKQKPTPIGDLYKSLKKKNNILIASASAEENLLYLLRKLYGEIYFEEIIKMLAVLSLSSVPVSIKQLSRMCGEDKVTFKQLCYLEELRPLVNIIRTAQGNDISIHRREIIDMINNNYNSVVDRLIIDWYEEVISIVKETKGKPFDEVDLKFILNILTILSNINLSEVPFKIGKNISPLMDSLLSNLHKDGAYLDEQLHQSYYMFYHNINKLIKEYLKKGIEFDSDFYLRLLGNISEVFLNSGDIDFALDKLREGLDLLKKNNVKINAFTTAQAYGKIAALYSKIGNKDEAEIYFQLVSETAEAVEKALPHNNYRKILSFYTKAEGKIKEATHYKNRARYDKAIDVLNKLLNEIFEIEKGEFKDDPLVKTIKLSCYKIYGNIYKRTNPSKALQYMFQAQELLPVFYKHDEVKAKGTESDLLLNIGQVYRQLNQPVTAMQCYDKALKINDELLQSGGTIPCEEVCILYNSKGNIERDLRNHSKSIEYYTQAIEYYEKCQREGKSIVPNLYVSSLISRSEAYSALGKYTEAQKDNQKAQKINFDYEQVMHTLRGKH